ncbi:hypothetical protein SLEP1_g20996 [Rubroshorea leprosula]|uniref:Uncharacterized protein n=1 Tax=Rubroshorea leprosula TaxID=152421 RepID=A0AAV5JDN6_9ROSI|nr:hypothetical protein SLEP1_g20996 [Rubroshorea leprosula]
MNCLGFKVMDGCRRQLPSNHLLHFISLVLMDAEDDSLSVNQLPGFIIHKLEIVLFTIVKLYSGL